MPKLVGMAQLSRPYQVALAVLLLLAVVWAVAIRPHSSSTGGSGAYPVASAPAAPASSSASASSSVYHGSAPGVAGLTRAIAKAHGAVLTSEHNAKQLTERSAQASSTTAGAGTAAAAGTSATSSHAVAKTAPAAKAPAASVAGTPKVAKQGIKAQSGAGRTPARQALVERALHEGKVAVILFWSNKGTDDVAVHEELRVLEAVHHLIRPLARTPQVRRNLKLSGLELQKPFAAFFASAKDVASFGSITRRVQIYSTPTILIVGKSGKTTVITGLTDAYSIEQAIDEIRHP